MIFMSGTPQTTKKLIADFESQKKTIAETIKRVDIRTNLQVRGVLHVQG